MRYFSFIIFIFLFACNSPEKKEGKLQVKTARDTAFTSAAKIVTKGIPEGFVQRDYTVSSDGKMAYTTIELPNRSRRFILQIDLEKNLAVLAGFSGRYNDLEPFLTPDGDYLLFASDRPLSKQDSTSDFNLWYAGVDGRDVKEPKPFSDRINTEQDEFYPAMNQSGDLYFTAKYGQAQRDDLYRASRNDSGFAVPEKLPFCRDEYYEFNAYISPDDQLLIFSSYGRSGEVGGGDLYFVRRSAAGEWMDVEIVEKFNTRSLDFSPFLRRDTLYFTSRRQDASWLSREFSYLAEIASHADSAAIGEQGIYMVPWNIKQ